METKLGPGDIVWLISKIPKATHTKTEKMITIKEMQRNILLDLYTEYQEKLKKHECPESARIIATVSIWRLAKKYSINQKSMRKNIIDPLIKEGLIEERETKVKLNLTEEGIRHIEENYPKDALARAL